VGYYQYPVTVLAANNGNYINDASFGSTDGSDVSVWGLGSGQYYVTCHPATYVSVSAPNYASVYFLPMVGTVNLTYTGGWPQTY
jgi:hypothetical protein